MLWSVWFYRAVFAGACVVGIVLFGFSAPGTGLLVILCGAGIVVIGAFANAYHEQGKRGVAKVALAGLGDFLSNFLGF